MFSAEFLNKLCRRISGLCKHDGRSTFKNRIKFFKVHFRLLKCSFEEGVFYNDKFNIVVKAFSSQVTCISCIKLSSISQIKVTVLFESLSKAVYDSIFFFPSHFSFKYLT